MCVFVTVPHAASFLVCSLHCSQLTKLPRSQPSIVRRQLEKTGPLEAMLPMSPYISKCIMAPICQRLDEPYTAQPVKRIHALLDM